MTMMTNGGDASSPAAPVWPRTSVAERRQPITVIEARPETLRARLAALWRYRGFYGLLFKDITTRKSRGTLLGFWWLIIRPLIPAAALIFVFGNMQPLDTGVPYPIFFLSGYIPWRMFQSAMMYLPRTLTWTQGIMRRTYFPRLLVPLAGFGMTFIELAVLLVVFAIVTTLTVANGAPFPLHLGWHTLWLLPCLLAALLLALAFGLVFSVVALFFRDVIFSLRFFSQIFMFLTPVIYPVTFVPEAYRWVLYALNPMAQVVLVSRWALTGHGEFDLPFVLLSFGSILAAVVAGVAFFLRAETHLGDQM